MGIKIMYETLRIRATIEAKAIYQKVQAYSHKSAPTVRNFYRYKVARYTQMRDLLEAIKQQTLQTDEEITKAIQRIHRYKQACYADWKMIKALVQG